MSDKKFHYLTVKEKIEETPSTVSLVFDVPESLANTFRYKAGQYLTLRFYLEAQEYRRAYSMSSSPQEPQLKVTVKKVENGIISNHIYKELSVGDQVEIMPPQGRFTVKPQEENRKTYYFIGAGSGITPLMSMLKTILEAEPQSTVFLYYGSKNEDEIIFRKEIDQLATTYANQFFVDYTLSQPSRDKSGLAGIFGKGKITWKGMLGRINRTNTAKYLEDRMPHYTTSEYYLCGPGNMIQVVTDVLLARGVDEKDIHIELFTSAEAPSDQPTNIKKVSPDTVNALINLDGDTHNIYIPKGKTILQALQDNKIEAPYSCSTGSCATCIAKLNKGKVDMESCFALDPDEIEEGYILTCQAIPSTSEIEVDYNV